MKKVRLEYSNSRDKNIIGIVCQKPDYWLVLQLNKHLDIHLIRQKDIPVYQERLQVNVPFHFFSCVNNWEQNIFFFKNYSSISTLFTKYKNFDYFLILDNAIPVEESIANIRKINEVNAVLSFPIDSIPKIEYFLEDLEFHILEINKGL
jgi:hypothetical protein